MRAALPRRAFGAFGPRRSVSRAARAARWPPRTWATSRPSSGARRRGWLEPQRPERTLGTSTSWRFAVCSRRGARGEKTPSTTLPPLETHLSNDVTVPRPRPIAQHRSTTPALESLEPYIGATSARTSPAPERALLLSHPSRAAPSETPRPTSAPFPILPRRFTPPRGRRPRSHHAPRGCRKLRRSPRRARPRRPRATPLRRRARSPRRSAMGRALHGSRGDPRARRSDDDGDARLRRGLDATMWRIRRGVGANTRDFPGVGRRVPRPRRRGVNGVRRGGAGGESRLVGISPERYGGDVRSRAAADDDAGTRGDALGVSSGGARGDVRDDAWRSSSLEFFKSKSSASRRLSLASSLSASLPRAWFGLPFPPSDNKNNAYSHTAGRVVQR